MKIGFEAKRVYQNQTGLGHYSRTLVSSLAEFYPENEYFLFAPKLTDQYIHFNRNIHSVTPLGVQKLTKSLWRTYGITREINKLNLDIFHGLSHELPVGIEKTKTKSVVTIHDLIFERFPEQYKPLDRAIYRKKILHACKNGNGIIAISQQTRQDLIDLYKVNEHKIRVCYQSCNPSYYQQLGIDEIERIKNKYHLPEKYFLNVGSIIERKDLLTICRALARIPEEIRWPLVVIGNGSDYKEKVKKYIAAENLENSVIFLSETNLANDPSFLNSVDFPAIYQAAEAFIYPSVFEGFGIPVLEAMAGGTPVIVAKSSCMPETAGTAGIYISPADDRELANIMEQFISGSLSKKTLRPGCILQAEKFSVENCAKGVMDYYNHLQNR